MYWRRVFSIPLVFSVLTTAIGCRQYKAEQIPGTYRGSHFGGDETIVISPDGTFHQTFSSLTANYNCSGTWRVQDDVIRFTPFLYLTQDGTFLPHEVGTFSTRWDDVRGSLCFGEDHDYTVSK